MNRIIRLLLSLALPSIASATDVKGKVVDAETGEAIARARVIGRLSIQRQTTGYVPPETREATILTDPEGNFVFHNADGGYLELAAERIGYVTNPTQSSAHLQVPREQPLDPISLRLTRQAVLKGRLAEERGQPLSGQVTLFYERPGPASKPQLLRTIHVDRTGEFRFSNLDYGRYFLKVSSAVAGASGFAGKAYPPRYYPNCTDLLSAGAFNLSPGQEQNVEFAVAAMPAHQIRGRFESGERPGITLFEGNGEAGLVNIEVEVDEKMQTFTVSGVPAGVYTLRAAWGNGSSAAPLTLTVEDADLTGIVLTPERAK